MLENQNIICFGFADWDNPYRTNQHHFMERLSKTNRVLFIESLGLRRPTFQKKDILRILRRLKGWMKGVKRKSENLYVFSPLVLPFHRYAIVRQFNRWFLKAQLDYIVKKYSFQCPIIWSYIPNAVEFLGKEFRGHDTQLFFRFWSTPLGRHELSYVSPEFPEFQNSPGFIHG
jgi:hypothetical protein